MKMKIVLLLHTTSNISQDPQLIVDTRKMFGKLSLGSIHGMYREIVSLDTIVRANTLSDVLDQIAKAPYQEIADTITSCFNCPRVVVGYPKVTPRGIFVTYNRGELERNMLFLKIVVEPV